MSTTPKLVQEIKPLPVLQARTKNHRLRVAAYCRVSTDQVAQETSIQTQITYYEDLIRSNPEWEYAGVFSDDGISGIRDDNRPGFMSLISLCKKGKVDLILVKSLSGFPGTPCSASLTSGCSKSGASPSASKRRGWTPPWPPAKLLYLDQRLCPRGERVPQQ